MKKILLAHPCYGPLDPYINKALRVSMMGAARVAEWVGDVSAIRQGWVGARNQAVQDALSDAPDADGILWVDDDVWLPPTALSRLLSYDMDFVTGVVYQKFGDYNPLVADWTGRGFQYWRTYPENVLAPARGCGFGIVYTSTKMLRAIDTLPRKAPKGQVYCQENGWFKQFPGDWFGSGSEEPMSEDFSFCRRAMAAGFQLYADTGLECPHQRGPEFSTKKDAERHWAKKKAEFDAIKEKVKGLNAKGSDVGGGKYEDAACSDTSSRGADRDNDAGHRDAAQAGRAMGPRSISMAAGGQLFRRDSRLRDSGAPRDAGIGARVLQALRGVLSNPEAGRLPLRVGSGVEQSLGVGGSVSPKGDN